MKNLIILAAIITSFASQARSLYPEIYSARVISEQTTNNHQQFISGEITINKMNRTLTLDLLHGPNCRPHMFCIEIVYTKKIELPITDISVDSCGGVHYVAKKDERPVDGVFEYVKVSDYTDFVCPTFNILPHTGIDYQIKYYDRLKGEEVIKENYYTAEELVLKY